MTNNAEREDFAGWFEREYPAEYASAMRGGAISRHHMQACEKAWKEGQARAQASGVPDGWKLVPTDMTPEMERAERLEFCRVMVYEGPHKTTYKANCSAYKAMLSAAPKPPKSASVPVERLEALLTRCAIGCYAFTVPQKWIEELIAEYKA